MKVYHIIYKECNASTQEIGLRWSNVSGLSLIDCINHLIKSIDNESHDIGAQKFLLKIESVSLIIDA